MSERRSFDPIAMAVISAGILLIVVLALGY
jgi:hypothetical protein